MNTNRRQFAKQVALGSTSITLLSGCIGINDGGNNGGSDSNTSGGGNGFPEERITLVVPGGAGGGTDTYVREISPVLSSALGVQVEVDNRPGGNQLIGPGYAHNQEADGYTVAVMNLPASAASWMIEEPDFDIRDFEGLGGFAREGGVMVVNNEYADMDPEEFLDLYREGELTQIGVVHLGSNHIAGAVLESEEWFDIDVEWIGYDDAAEHNRAVASGELPAALSSMGGAAGLVAEGEISALFQTIETDLFDVPTLEDMGYDPIDFANIHRGMFVLNDVPDERKNILEEAIREAVTSDEVTNWAEETDQNVEYIPRDEFNQIFNSTFEELPNHVDLDQFKE